MDRARVSSITHGDLAFHDPVDPRRVDEVLAHARLRPRQRVLDVGCGPGELVIRAAERHGTSGVGVDLAEVQVREARRRAAQRAPTSRLEFVAADAAAWEPDPAGFDLVACIGSSHALGGLSDALQRMAAWTRPGGHVLLGDGYWRRRPDPAYLDALGATEDELPDWTGLVRSGEPHGLDPAYVATAGEEEWDRYEWTLIANGLRFAAERPDDPLSGDVRAWAQGARSRVLSPGGRDTIGFALVLYRRA